MVVSMFSTDLIHGKASIILSAWNHGKGDVGVPAGLCSRGPAFVSLLIREIRKSNWLIATGSHLNIPCGLLYKQRHFNSFCFFLFYWKSSRAGLFFCLFSFSVPGIELTI